MKTTRITPLFIALLTLGFSSGVFAEDLAKRYPATLDRDKNPQANVPTYAWTVEPKDVWRIDSFRYAMGEQLVVELGPSTVVFGCHGSNVLWAALFPDTPGKIVSAPQGAGEQITSIFIRLHPARVGELFPAATVTGPGEERWIMQARRLANHKISSSWWGGNNPVVPYRESIVLDADTAQGNRRFYTLVDTTAGKLEYVDAFRARSLPAPRPVERDEALAIFDVVWYAFDREYAMFTIKPGVDWAKLRREYRPKAEAAADNAQLADALAQMLAHLEDLHVFVSVDGQYVPGYSRERPANIHMDAVRKIIGPLNNTQHDLLWAITPDGIGYLNIHRLSDGALPAALDGALAQMGNTRGLIVDLRANGGGNEVIGQHVAGRFTDQRRVYSLSQYRSGQKHTDLGPRLERSFEPSGPWHYTGPVIMLQGQFTMSSAESFALMFAQCPQVTTMGDRTAGSSANPRRIEPGAGITVNLPRWLDLDPTGNPIDAVGIAPDVKLDTPPESFSVDSDPVLSAALEKLRAMPPAPGGTGVLQKRP